MAKLEIADQGVIYRNPLPVHWVINAFFPSVYRFDDGEILCVLRVGGAMYSSDGMVELFRSSDGGKAWQPQGPLRDRADDSVHYSLESLCLVSDALPCAGGPDEDYTHGDGQVYRKVCGVARRYSDDFIIGAAMLVPDSFRNFVCLTHLPPHEVIRTVTFNPARSLGFDDRMGLIAPGRAADLVAWDERLQVQRIWKRGVEIAPSSYSELG